MALEDRKTGEMVVKYGCPIGHTTTDVPAGSWLHSHNMATNLEGVLDYTYEPVSPDRNAPVFCLIHLWATCVQTVGQPSAMRSGSSRRYLASTPR